MFGKKSWKNPAPDGIDEPDYSDSPVLSDPDDSSETGTTTYPAYNAIKSSSVNLKLYSPKSHKEATEIADAVMKKCIVVLDISTLPADSAMRLIDFLSGVVHVLGGKLERMNNGTFIVAPNGVDVDQLMAGENKNY